MSDDVVMHFSSNSSNQSDHSLPDKIAKLEARLTGKSASSTKPHQVSVWPSASAADKVVASAPVEMSEVSISDSDDEDTGDFLIRANTIKRQKVEEFNSSSVVDHAENNGEMKPQEAAYDGRKKDAETKTGIDVNKKKQGRGRGSSTGRGRGSKTNNGVTKTQILAAPVSAANYQPDVSDQKDFRPAGKLRNGECSRQDVSFSDYVIMSFIQKFSQKVSQMDPEQVSDGTSRPPELTADERNALFLQSTFEDDRGRPFGVGSLRRSIDNVCSDGSGSSSSQAEFQTLREELMTLKQKLVDHEAWKQEQERLNAERDARMEAMMTFFRETNPTLVATLFPPQPVNQPLDRNSTFQTADPDSQNYEPDNVL